MCFALDGGVWLHRHTLRGQPMAHLVSADKERLLAMGRELDLHPAWLQHKPLKDPRLWGERLERLEDVKKRREKET